MKLTLLFALTILFCLTFNGCKKYENGPSISLRTKKARVANRWKIDKILVNGIDSTLVFTNREIMTYTLSKQGAATIICKDLIKGWINTENGTWKFKNKKEDIEFNLVSEVTHQVEDETWHIIKLEEKSFWYTVEENNTIEEYRLIPE